MKKNDNLCLQRYIQASSFGKNIFSFYVALQVVKLLLPLAAPQRTLMENGLSSHRVGRTTSRFLPLHKYEEGLLGGRRGGVVKKKSLNLHWNHLKSRWSRTFFKIQLVTVFGCEAVQRFALSNRRRVWCRLTWKVMLGSLRNIDVYE